ncbi:hypothetical protein [Pseudomonas sp. HY13-MNA-CIBAN-0226]|uniref:hypothetical protein n=1 Tax=Pseudomonas sp. HY13-MNA-CIBAN-0226 TaxID=3140473 RepID=UPI00331ABE1C
MSDLIDELRKSGVDRFALHCITNVVTELDAVMSCSGGLLVTLEATLEYQDSDSATSEAAKAQTSWHQPRR